MASGANDISHHHSQATQSGKNSPDYLLQFLKQLDFMLERAIRAVRKVYAQASSHDPYRGLHIGEEEVEGLLIREPGASIFHTGGQTPEELLANLTNDHPRFAKLQGTFGLSLFDLQVIVIGLAPELDLRYERLYAYLQDDVTRKRPSLDLVLNLLCPTFEAKLTARQRFTPDSPLLKNYLIQLFDDPAQHQPPMLSKYLRVDERVVNYLLGFDELDARLLPYARHTLPRTGYEDLLLPLDIKRRLVALTRKKDQQLVIYFQGPYGVGKQSTAEAICRELGVELLVVDGRNVLLNAELAGIERIVRLAVREAALRRAALYWDGFDALMPDEKQLSRAVLLRELGTRRGITFLAGDTIWEPVDTLQDLPFVRIEIPHPTHAERCQLWKTSLNGDTPIAADIDLSSLANKFCFSGGQIRDAAATARNLALWRNPESGEATMSDLYAACRLQSNRKLATLAQKIVPNYGWEDIVLPDDQMRQLHEITNHVKYQNLVMTEWGYSRKFALGNGLTALFAGPSGSGKTMAAEVIAKELELELYKIDLSRVVSKYIGETEKNLDLIYSAANDSNAILFFDEADALFGKRSEVKDAHDRYANIEISYLLQKMEEYNGIVILATNLKANMDEAFVRRLRFIVDFPFPNEKYREKIWLNIVPSDVPIGQDISFSKLAKAVKISGGGIKNISLRAAYLAAEDNSALSMNHLARAAKYELTKSGTLFVDADLKTI